ncbi:hypothetical protein B0H34DRAFT_659078 [Crassisporium funariophilum]|nr:hypothetical protein B0H34DRAFT_659078 [Crassisporium funariophilum]
MQIQGIPAFYELQLIILSVVCVVSLIADRYLSSKARRNQAKGEVGHQGNGKSGSSNPALAALTRKYLVVYALVMGADWLQGPYVYSLYKDQYAFPERLVAGLFVTGFVSAGLAAPLVGVWADQQYVGSDYISERNKPTCCLISGRRTSCLIFCVTYTTACGCIMIPYLPILFFGRILGGVSTAILFSAFESWLISESTSVTLHSTDLSTIMGRATLINGFIATGAGVVSNKLVEATHNFVSPFMASGAILVLAWLLIGRTWTENYGSLSRTTDRDILQIRRMGHACNIVRQDPLLLVLGLTQTCFEGSMYLFVFLWVPALQEYAKGTPSISLPLGYIFSSFMISMMLGSLIYTAIVSRSKKPISNIEGNSSLKLHAQLSSTVCAVSAFALASSAASKDEHVRFYAFCLFETCVGMYYPVQGTLRGTLISNEHRATLSSLFRVPLNIFVVVSLLTGVSSARRTVLVACAMMLAFSSLMTAVVIVGHSKKTHSIQSNDQDRE